MTAVAAQPELAARIAALFSRWDREDCPGCVVGVIRDGELVHHHSAGMADLEHEVRLGPASVFDIASMSKQFTAAAVLILDQRGELSLDDDVQSYIPELPDYGTPISLRHLVHHTSGIRDYLALRHLAGAHDSDHFDMQDALDLVVRQRDLNFVPGTEHRYSNSGYVLLAIIVSRVTGTSFAAWCATEILEPLGMTGSRFRDDATTIIPGLVQSYALRDDGGLHKTIPNDDAVGDGALHTTLGDLVRWERNYLQETVGGSGFTALMSAPGTPEGAEDSYAFGLSIGEYRGLPTVSHGGGLHGFSGEFLRFPEQRVAIICMANRGSFPSHTLARSLADIVLEDVLAPVESSAAAAAPTGAEPESGPAVPAALLESLPGLYRQEETGLVIEIAREGDQLRGVLMDKPAPFSHAGGTRFVTTLQELQLEAVFEDVESETPVIRFEYGGDTLLAATRIKPVDPGSLDLNAYAGTFHSDELLIDATVSHEGDSLYVRRGPARRDALRATLPDQFALPFGGLEFTRAEDGSVDGFLLSMSRTSAVSFRRTAAA